MRVLFFILIFASVAPLCPARAAVEVLALGRNSWAVRDLAEFGVAEDPHFGKFTIPPFIERKDELRTLRLFFAHQDLLLRKLSDAELTNTGLGFFLFEVLAQVKWSWGSLAENTAAEVTSQGFRLNKYIFPKLSPEHQVATLIHLAFELLLKSDMENKYQAVALTGSLFNEDIFCGRAGGCLPPFLKLPLNIEWVTSFSPYHLALEIFTADQTKSYKLGIKELSRPHLPFQLAAFPEKVCGSEFQNFYVEPKFLILTMHRPPYHLELIPPALPGQPLKGRISLRRQSSVQVLFYHSWQECDADLGFQIQHWYKELL